MCCLSHSYYRYHYLIYRYPNGTVIAYNRCHMNTNLRTKVEVKKVLDHVGYFHWAVIQDNRVRELFKDPQDAMTMMSNLISDWESKDE